MIRNMLLVTLLISACLLGSTESVLAQDSITEDFSTTTYMNPTWTYADWDTVSGLLKQRTYAPFQIDTFSDSYIGLRAVADGNTVIVAAAGLGIKIYRTDGESYYSAAVDFNPSGSGYTRGVAIAGNYAYLADGLNGLVTVDISNPQIPAETDVYNTSGYAWDVAVSGNRAYVADGSYGLLVFDITNAASPSYLTSLSLGGTVESVCLVGGKAYLAGTGGTLHIVSIAAEPSPLLYDSLSLPANAKDVQVAGDYAYVADSNAGLQVVDISDSYNPVIVATLDTPGAASNIEISGTTVYLADGGPGLQIIDISNPLLPTLKHTYDISESVNGLHVLGNYAIMATTTSGIHVGQVSNFVPMHQIGQDNTGATEPRKICVEGNYAYAINATELIITDISDKTSPTVVSTTPISGSPQDMEVIDDYAFIVHGTTDFMSVYYVGDVLNPINTSSISGSIHARTLAIDGRYAFVARSDGGLEVVNIHDPLSIISVGTLTDSNHYDDIVVSGNHLFVSVQYGGIKVFDVSNPMVPALIGSAPTGGNASQIAVNGNFLYVGCSNSTVEVYNISTPNILVYTSTYATTYVCSDIAVVGNRIYMAIGYYGIESAYLHNLGGLLTNYERYHEASGNWGTIAVSGDYLFTGSQYDRFVIARILQDEYHNSSAVSKLFIETPDVVKKIRYTSNQTGTVSWTVRQWDTWNATSLSEPNTWVTPSYGTQWFTWRATTSYDPGGISTVDDVTFEMLYERAQITSVADIANDQGKQVRVEWARSGNDFVGATDQIVEYGVYRKVDSNLVSKAAAVSTAHESPAIQAHSLALKSSGWDFVASHQVLVKDYYSVVVPTLADSTIADGQYYSTFKVFALTATPGVFFESHADSGFSSDNLAPAVPQGMTAAYLTESVTLDWTDVEDADVQYYRVYRSSDPSFIPSPATLVMSVAASNWTDTNAGAWNEYYKVTAVDFSGNESEPAQPGAVSDVPAGIVNRYALHNASPNPFNPATVISFDLPRASRVKLTIHDLAGRLVRTLVQENREAGSHQVVWEGRNNNGGQVSSGVYLYRIEAGTFTEARQMVLVK